jgi:hypothetical protein
MMIEVVRLAGFSGAIWRRPIAHKGGLIHRTAEGPKGLRTLLPFLVLRIGAKAPIARGGIDTCEHSLAKSGQKRRAHTIYTFAIASRGYRCRLPARKLSKK